MKNYQILEITDMAPRDGLAAPEDTTVDEGARSKVRGQCRQGQSSYGRRLSQNC
jgi:hypothetical protein